MAERGLTEVDLRDASGSCVAVAVLKDAGHRQPVCVSVGHRVALRTAVELVQRCCLHRVPEPVRLADIASRQAAAVAAQASNAELVSLMFT